jgi:hypothetical protein
MRSRGTRPEFAGGFTIEAVPIIAVPIAAPLCDLRREVLHNVGEDVPPKRPDREFGGAGLVFRLVAENIKTHFRFSFSGRFL